MNANLKTHWENIYTTKQPNEVSWTQDVPSTSLDFIRKFQPNKYASIIDVGGGDSKLVDFLLADGYTDITVLDISQAAISRAKNRLGDKADKVTWIVNDILDFIPSKKYDLWHDRAAFHFLTDSLAVDRYTDTVTKAVNGMVIIGTFSTDGPLKCSGLPIKQYSEETLGKQFSAVGFEKLSCRQVNHTTPSGAIQNFIFCGFSKKSHLF